MVLFAMKTTVLVLILTGFATSAFAIDQAQLDNRIRTLTAKLVAMQEKPDRCIPADKLREARGIILLDRTKAGFLFAYEGGNGVALVKDPKTGQWSAPAFVSAFDASLGFQVGGQQSFDAILLMDDYSTRLLTESDVRFGGEAQGTGGEATAGVEGKVSSPERAVQVYDDRNGLYGGVDVAGGAISPDEAADRAYYQAVVSTKDILFDAKVKPTAAALTLVAKLNAYSRPAGLSQNTSP